MGTRPSKLPRWATSVAAQIIEPTEAAKDLGHVPNTVLTAQLSNWLQNTVYQWLLYIDSGILGVAAQVAPAALLAPGEVYVASSTVTVTLPANPQPGWTCGVLCTAVGTTLTVAGNGKSLANPRNPGGTMDLSQTIPIAATCFLSWTYAGDAWRMRDVSGLVAPSVMRDACVTNTSPIDMNGQQLTNLANPTAAQSAATRQYVDLAATDPTINGFRLSGSSTSPTTPEGNPSTLYLTEYKGNRIGLYVTSVARWVAVAPSVQPSMVLSGMTQWTLYDVFASSTDGTSVQLERVAWASSSARATAITRLAGTGVWTKSGDVTRRYVGTFRASSATTTIMTPTTGTDASSSQMGIWNVDNRIPIAMQWYLATTWNVSSANAWMRWGNYGNPGLEYVVGLQADAVQAHAAASVYFGGTTDAMVALSENGTSPLGIHPHCTGVNATAHNLIGQLALLPVLGLRALVPIVWSSLTSASLQGATAISNQERSGMTAIVWG